MSRAFDDIRNLLKQIHSDRERFGDFTPAPTFGLNSSASPIVQPPPPPNLDDQNYLAYLITEVIRPETWIDNGGDSGLIQCTDGRLIVVQTEEQHAIIKELLSQLSCTSGMEQGSLT